MSELTRCEFFLAAGAEEELGLRALLSSLPPGVECNLQPVFEKPSADRLFQAPTQRMDPMLTGFLVGVATNVAADLVVELVKWGLNNGRKRTGDLASPGGDVETDRKEGASGS